MELERGAGIALWRQIKSILERELREMPHVPDQKLPTEKTLAERFRVNRHTIRRALGVLEAEGLVQVEQGRGAFVRGKPVNYHMDRPRFTESLLRQHKSPESVLLSAAVVPAPPKAVAALELKNGDRVVRLDILAKADGMPLLAKTSYFPHQRFPGLAEAYKATLSTTAALARCGLTHYRRKWTVVTARMPTPRENGLLEQPNGRPVLVTESLNEDATGVPVEWG